MRLNLGCSDAHMPQDIGWVNVDRVPPADQIVNLDAAIAGCWPWLDNSIEEIRAYDIFEHLSNKIDTMNEAYRVLEPDGKLDLFIPTTDGRGAFQDPTHKTFWTPNDLFYFCGIFAEWRRFHVAYGINCDFRIVSKDHVRYDNEVWKMHAILEAVK